MRNGLVTATSLPYTQQLNGKVERIAGIINKMADCMFSRLPSMVQFLEPALLSTLQPQACCGRAQPAASAKWSYVSCGTADQKVGFAR
jgi:hypothetical protein